MRGVTYLLRFGLGLVCLGSAVPVVAGGIVFGFIAARIKTSRSVAPLRPKPTQTPGCSCRPHVDGFHERAVVSTFSSRSFR